MKVKINVLIALMVTVSLVAGITPKNCAESADTPKITTWTKFSSWAYDIEYEGLQSSDGEILLPCVFRSIEVLSELAIVYSDITDLFYLYDWKHRAFIDSYPLICPNGKYIMVGESCSEGYYGLLDQFGNVVIEMKWEWMGAVEDEVVWIGDETGEVNLLHIPSGKLLLTTGARYCTDFSYGYSGFYRDNKVYFVDQEGHLEPVFISDEAAQRHLQCGSLLPQLKLKFQTPLRDGEQHSSSQRCVRQSSATEVFPTHEA